MDNKITLLRFVDPHHFWYKRDLVGVYRQEQQILQRAFNHCCSNLYDAEGAGPDEYYEPTVGEIVAVYDPALKKWTRCRVIGGTWEDDRTIRTYQLCPLDGTLTEAAAKHVKPLPPAYSNPHPNILMQGGLRNIVPKRMVYEQTETGPRKKRDKVLAKWNCNLKNITMAMEALIEEAQEAYFDGIISQRIAEEEIQFGDLWFKTKRGMINATQIVLQLGFSTLINESLFLEYTIVFKGAEDATSLPTSDPDRWLVQPIGEQHSGDNRELAALESPPPVNGSVAPEPCQQSPEPVDSFTRNVDRLLLMCDIVKNAVENSTTIKEEEEPVQSPPETMSFRLFFHPTENVTRIAQCSKMEQCNPSVLRLQTALVYGSALPRLIKSIEKSNFCPSVLAQLEELGIRGLTCLQGYMWPHITRSNSVVCVSAAGTGKTIGYLPAVCSLIKMRIEESLVVKAAGPVGIIVCSSSKEVEQIGSLCRMMLESCTQEHMAVVECYGVRSMYEACNQLLSGCALLVTTAPAYRRLCVAIPEAFVNERIQIAVIDGYDQILQRFGRDVQLLLKNCDKPNLQLIVTARYCDPTLCSFLPRYRAMVACIGSYLEAAVFARMKFQVRLLHRDSSKPGALAEYIRQHNYAAQATIVVCKAEEIDPIVEAFREHFIFSVVCESTGNAKGFNRDVGWEDLEPGERIVLLCVDEALDDLRITKAQHIIHYSLPDSWARFTQRYATSSDYYGLIDVGDPHTLPSTLVLLDENDHRLIPQLVAFLEVHRMHIPSELRECEQNISNLLEYMRVDAGRAKCALCPHLLARGDCRSMRTCLYRHDLMACDFASDDPLPASGPVVKLFIVRVYSPVHFVARFAEDTHVSFMQDFHLQEYFASPQHCQTHVGAKVNDLCAVFFEGIYCRGRIVFLELEPDSTKAGAAQVKLIDIGPTVDVQPIDLLVLPRHFRVLSDQAFEVRIAGVVPHDCDEHWDLEATRYVKERIEEHGLEPNCYTEGRLLLALSGMIWIDELALVEQQEEMKKPVTWAQIKSSILSEQFGVYDEESFARLRQIVQTSVAALADPRGADWTPEGTRFLKILQIIVLEEIQQEFVKNKKKSPFSPEDESTDEDEDEDEHEEHTVTRGWLYSGESKPRRQVASNPVVPAVVPAVVPPVVPPVVPDKEERWDI